MRDYCKFLTAVAGQLLAVAPILFAPCAPAAAKASQFAVIHAFDLATDGQDPAGPLIFANGNLIGTLAYGGHHGRGAVFAITPAGTETFLTPSNFKKGEHPSQGVIQDGKLFYGVALVGGVHNPTCHSQGAQGCGTVFSVSATGKIKLVYAFQDGAAGASFFGTPVNIGGTLYGIGGNDTNGLVWSLTPSGAFSVLYTFAGGTDGAGPTGVIDVGGVLYGFTNEGGTYNKGTVFSLTTSGTETVLYSFGATANDAVYPIAPPVYVNGLLYAATSSGGDVTDRQCLPNGCGTIFSVSLSGVETVLYQFPKQYGSSNNPSALVELNGLLYGTGQFGPKGCGVIFSISPQGQFNDAYDFNKAQNDGCSPSGPLLDVNGVLYGLTSLDGAGNEGTLYSFTPN